MSFRRDKACFPVDLYDVINIINPSISSIILVFLKPCNKQKDGSTNTPTYKIQNFCTERVRFPFGLSSTEHHALPSYDVSTQNQTPFSSDRPPAPPSPFGQHSNQPPRDSRVRAISSTYMLKTSTLYMPNSKHSKPVSSARTSRR